MYDSTPQFEALAFLAAALALFALAACLRMDNIVYRMKRSLNRIERQLGIKETKDFSFRDFQTLLEEIEKKAKKNERNGMIEDWGDDDDDHSD